MWLRNLFDSLKTWRSPVQTARRREAPRRSPVSRLAVEELEDRSVPASLSIGDAQVMEGVSGSQTAEVMVILSTPSTKTIRVNYNTAFGSALAGTDYDAVSGTLTFAPGETNKSILVPVHGDRVVEYDEWFHINLQRSKGGAKIADAWGTVTILDSSPRINMGYATASEADGSMTFTVSLSAAYDQPVTVNFSTHDGVAVPGLWDATYGGQDYVGTSGTLTFAPSETTKTITVQIIGDMTPEYDEAFYVDLSGASNALIYDVDGTGLILGELGPLPD